MEKIMLVMTRNKDDEKDLSLIHIQMCIRDREYSQLVNAMGGEVINISATSDNHINSMDMNKDYGDGANPVILKSEFIMSRCEQLIGGTKLGAKQKSIIDRCTARDVYKRQTGDNLDEYREEYNKMLLDKATGANSIVQDKYITCLLYTSSCV